MIEFTEEEKQKQLAAMCDIEFFKGIYLDVYAFCYWINQALMWDGVVDPNPNDVMRLFLDLVTDYVENDNQITEAPVIDITDDMYVCYPEGKALLIHASLVVHVAHDFVYRLGRDFLKILHNEKVPSFSYWLTSDYLFTYSVLNSMFSQFRGLHKRNSGIRDLILGLHLSRKFVSDDECAVRLGEKSETHEYARKRIKCAITDEYFLEAIALVESMLSDRLSMVIFLNGKNNQSKSFNELIHQCHSFLGDDLFNTLNDWRKSRNFGIHSLVRSSPVDEQIAPERFLEMAKEIAVKGSELVVRIEDWFDDYVNDNLNVFNIRMK